MAARGGSKSDLDIPGGFGSHRGKGTDERQNLAIAKLLVY